MIDFAGPWEVFQDVAVPGRDGDAFRLYTVAATRRPIRASGGMMIVPDYTFETAPTPKVIVKIIGTGLLALAGVTMVRFMRGPSGRSDI